MVILIIEIVFIIIITIILIIIIKIKNFILKIEKRRLKGVKFPGER